MMDTGDIMAASASMGQVKTSADAQVSLLRKALDVAKNANVQLLQALPPPPDAVTGAGQRLNVYA